MLQIRDMMTRDVLTVTPETTLREAAELFARHHISGAPVLAGHSVVGVVSTTDLLVFIASNDGGRANGYDRSDAESAERTAAEYDEEASGLFFTDQLPESDAEEAESFAMDGTPTVDLFSEHTVNEVMTREIYSLPPQARVTQAARCMGTKGVHRLLVLEAGNLAGILSTSDVARAMANREAIVPSVVMRP